MSGVVAAAFVGAAEDLPLGVGCRLGLLRRLPGWR